MTLIKHSKSALRRPCDGCGAQGGYWAYESDVDPKLDDYGWCPSCDQFHGPLVRANSDLTLHICAPEGTDDVTPTPAAATPGVSVSQDDRMAALAALLAPQEIDRKEVERIAREVVDGVVYPTKVIVVKDQVETELPDTSHTVLPTVVTLLMAELHVAMVGPAGTGKSTIGEQAADALGLDYGALSLSSQTPVSAVTGYMNATGQYVKTRFRELYENGGVFQFDEVDAGNPNTLVVVNAALSNSIMAFPDGMVKRHSDFRCVASANTYGRGANQAYVGRNKLDVAFLDRFELVTVEYDEGLENALAYGSGVDKKVADKVLTEVRRLRRNAEKEAMPDVVFSPRATVGMCKMIANGVSWDEAHAIRLRRGLTDKVWNVLNK